MIEQGRVQDRPGERDKIEDFDALVPAHRWAKLGGEFVDVAMVPTESVMQMVRFLDMASEIKASKTGLSVEQADHYFAELLAVIASVVEPRNPKMSMQFLREKTTIIQLKAFVEFIALGVMGGNAEAAEHSA